MQYSLLLIQVLSLVSKSVIADRSAGCGESKAPGAPVEWSPLPGQVKLFRVNDRNVRITVPESYKKGQTSPVIIAYHDRDQAPEMLDFESTFGNAQGQWTSEFQRQTKGAESANYTADLAFTSYLVRDLESLVCLDTAQVYAVGLGIGGGMVHLLACDENLSKIFAAYAAVGGAFGKGKRGTYPWGRCDTSLSQTPMLEIHGTDDRIFSYYLAEGENGKIRQIPLHWLDDWAERNSCGEKEDEPVRSAVDRATFTTKLEGGYLTETVEYGGAVIRSAHKCYQNLADFENAPFPQHKISDEEATVLHYQVKDFGHGWPRQQLQPQGKIMFKDVAVEVKSDSLFFDSSKIILDFFHGKRLPDEYAARDTSKTTKSSEQKIPSFDEFRERLNKMQQDQIAKGEPAYTDEEVQEAINRYKEMASKGRLSMKDEL